LKGLKAERLGEKITQRRGGNRGCAERMGARGEAVEDVGTPRLLIPATSGLLWLFSLARERGDYSIEIEFVKY
jgi:hypothetical protein